MLIIEIEDIVTQARKEAFACFFEVLFNDLKLVEFGGKFISVLDFDFPIHLEKEFDLRFKTKLY